MICSQPVITWDDRVQTLQNPLSLLSTLASRVPAQALLYCSQPLFAYICASFFTEVVHTCLAFGAGRKIRAIISFMLWPEFNSAYILLGFNVSEYMNYTYSLQVLEMNS